ncbi:MAG: tyrosine-protein phosphatase [Elusimicrobia bacterium]|nr:tyrosine-protein phosphatase [Elusimicrobiota bacterium]
MNRLPLFAALALVLAVSARPDAACAGLSSIFASEVDGVDIPNAREVGRGTVLRGSAPGTEGSKRARPASLAGDVADLRARGVTDVLIFKNTATAKDEVAEEIAAFSAAGFAAGRVRHIPFRWTALGPYRQTCEQTVDALNILLDAFSGGRSVFFHCTLGEDRTGYLAGLFRMLADGWDARRAFEEELCARGYEAGDPKKPQQIVDKVRAELTPAFLQMANLISTGVLSRSRLDRNVCAAGPNFDPKPVQGQFRCR